jgi:hypothetical protein
VAALIGHQLRIRPDFQFQRRSPSPAPEEYRVLRVVGSATFMIETPRIVMK